MQFCFSLVYVMLSCTFRYGRQDMDVMGVAFRRDLFVVTRQVYPELQDKEKLTHTKIQQKLLRKLGDNAFPFFFEVSEQQGPPSNQQLPTSNLQTWTLNTRYHCLSLAFQFPDNLPCSVALQPAPNDVGKVQQCHVLQDAQILFCCAAWQ